MNNNHERNREYPEVIYYSIQAMSESAQFSIALAVGIFGILTIFVSLDTHKGLTPTKGDEAFKLI